MILGLTVNCPAMAPRKTVAVAAEVTQAACSPSRHSSSSVVHWDADMTSSAMLMDWKLYWIEKFPIATCQ
ncbi:hypothetical protein EON64_09775 [archaeon]|nr:MAG: hypothetical protein EON64_09775 [archaeon]